jgi:hypothetical protein
MEETRWKLLNHDFLRVADRGGEMVNCLFDGDPKMGLTFIAAIDTAGWKLPLWIVCPGKTMRCEQRSQGGETLQRAIQEGELG